MSDKQRYVVIKGERVPVTEDVYRAYKRPLWAQRKRNERSRRCRDEDGNRCTDDCRLCPKLRSGSVLSLEEYMFTENEPVDLFDIYDYFEDILLKESLKVALSGLPEDEQQLIEVAYSGISERDAALVLNLPRNTFVYRRDVIVKKLRNFLA